jgi:hypothetical protein
MMMVTRERRAAGSVVAKIRSDGIEEFVDANWKACQHKSFLYVSMRASRRLYPRQKGQDQDHNPEDHHDSWGTDGGLDAPIVEMVRPERKVPGIVTGIDIVVAEEMARYPQDRDGKGENESM